MEYVIKRCYQFGYSSVLKFSLLALRKEAISEIKILVSWATHRERCTVRVKYYNIVVIYSMTYIYSLPKRVTRDMAKVIKIMERKPCRCFIFYDGHQHRRPFIKTKASKYRAIQRKIF